MSDKAARTALIITKKIIKAGGGPVTPELEGMEPMGDQPYERKLNSLGLYSKAAEIAHTLPQKAGSLDQFMAAIKNKGAKPAEIEHAGTPEVNNKTTSKQVGYHFERNAPDLSVVKLGGKRPQLNREQTDRMYALQNTRDSHPNAFSPDDRRELSRLANIANGRGGNYKPTKFHDYKTTGINGDNYREHLITTSSKGNPDEDSPRKKNFNSNHWDEPNVVAHVRMQDTTPYKNEQNIEPNAQNAKMIHGLIYNSIKDSLPVDWQHRYPEHFTQDHIEDAVARHGIGSPGVTNEEAEAYSNYHNLPYKSSFGRKEDPSKKILHVDEIQSDWGQQGRERGFQDADEVNRKKQEFKNLKSQHEALVNNMLEKDMSYDDMLNNPEFQSLQGRLDVIRNDLSKNHYNKIPKGPYVQNTQHWTDLALKHVLHEAAKGDYDKVQFATGKENADRYGLEKHFKEFHYNPENHILHTIDKDGYHNKRRGIKEKDLPENIGEELSKRLLASPVKTHDFGGYEEDVNSLKGDDLVSGGEGMKKFYDQMIPKSAMKQIQQHDPDIKPEKIVGKDGIERFGFSMTPKARESIKRGQTMFASGGPVRTTQKPDYTKAIHHVLDESKKLNPKLMEIEKKYEYEKSKGSYSVTRLNNKKLEKDPDYISALNEKSRLQNKMDSIKRARDSIYGKNINQVHMNQGASDFISGNHKSIPPVVFHGSKSDFNSFRHMSHFGTVQAATERLHKIKPLKVFGHDEKEAIYPVRMSMKSPLDVGKEENWVDNYDPLLQISNKLRSVGKHKEADSLHEIYGLHPHYANDLEKLSPQHRKINPYEQEHMKQAADIIKSAGYDGISYINEVEDPGSRSFIALHPEQVKSAIGNSGAFDPTNMDITKASGGAVTEAQKHAGNYKKTHINLQGLNIAIENAKGSTRSGKDKTGKAWSVKMPADYGYIKGTSGADGDHVDVYVGPDINSDSVFVVDQKDRVTGKFDEHKVMIGFKSLHDATEVYKSAFNDGKGADRMGHVARLTMHEFKNWLKNQNKTKPIAKQSLIDKALSIAQSAQRSA